MRLKNIVEGLEKGCAVPTAGLSTGRSRLSQIDRGIAAGFCIQITERPYV